MLRLPLLALLLAAPLGAQTVSDWASPAGDWASPAEVRADPPGPGPSPGTPSTPTQSVPVDGGLGLLALAGGAYAVRRLRSRT